jgi:NAD(P) transhydrogenase subunit beta
MGEELHAQPAWVLLAYLISGVCFILALRGLSSPESSRRGNFTGMVGMTVAVVTTLVTHLQWMQATGIGPNGTTVSDLNNHLFASAGQIFVAILIGGGIGLITARKIQMTAMPQLVAAFHSLVGLAAVLVGSAAYLNPEAFGIAVRITPIASPSFISIFPQSRIEMGLGVAIGAITTTRRW